jgi:hypothetical protein
MTRARTLMTALALGASLAACGGGTSSGDPGATSSGPLSGVVDGKPWTFVSGETSSFLSTADTYSAFLYELPITTACSLGGPDGSTREVNIPIPKALGTSTFKLTMDASFSVSDGMSTTNAYAATSGHVTVTELTATTIRGSAQVTARAGFSVSGTFEVTICP